MGPNVILGKFKLTWLTQAADVQILADVLEKMKRCWKAAALTTGCKLEINHRIPYSELRNEATLASDFDHNMKQEH